MTQAAFADLVVDIEDIVAAGDKVMVRLRWNGNAHRIVHGHAAIEQEDDLDGHRDEPDREREDRRTLVQFRRVRAAATVRESSSGG